MSWLEWIGVFTLVYLAGRLFRIGWAFARALTLALIIAHADRQRRENERRH